MPESSIRERLSRNASGVAGAVVTGTWLAAMFLDFEWWLPLMLFGYIVVVPVVAMVFEDEEADEPVEDDAGDERSGHARDALDRLRARYAEGELTDEQFDRKLDRLLETETPEDAAEYAQRERPRERERDVERER